MVIYLIVYTRARASECVWGEGGGSDAAAEGQCLRTKTGPGAVKSTPSTVIDHANSPEFKFALTSESVGAAATQSAMDFAALQPRSRTILSHPSFWLATVAV